MKFLLFMLLIICTSLARANDTLTRAQIYNFNVGDTFDYEEHIIQYSYCPTPCIVTLDLNNYTRCVIHQIYYSSNNDTLFIVRNWVYPLPGKSDTLILDSLQYPEIYIDSIINEPKQYSIDSNSTYNGHVLNEVTFDNSFYWYNYAYAQGLGKVFYYGYGGESGGYSDSLYLIYYARGAEIWGTPYYIANQSNLVHFIPIPEVCATWISEAPPPCGYLTQEIKTGTRIFTGGHTFVEMKYSCYDQQGSLLTADSLIGYFRNDTLNQKVYLYRDTNISPLVTYDFSIPADSFILSLSQVDVGGQPRTIWNGGSPISYIEGVGSIAGIYPFSCYVADAQPQAFTALSNLTCFSVCGQTLYPYDSTANCSLAAINNVPPINAEIKIYPNLNNGVFYVEVLNQSLQDAQLQITDITGREIKRCPLNNQLNNVSIEHAASGMYIWQVLSRGKLLQTGKLVKQ